jgi:signal transduction histidine kinase
VRLALLLVVLTSPAYAERMASVATLVRGVAHELNNPIGFISSNVEPLRRYSEFLAALAKRLSDGSSRSLEELAELTRLSPRKDLDYVCRDLEKMMDDITEGARRARLIIGDLQSLTADPRRGLETVDVQRVVRQTLSLLSPRLAAGTGVETRLEGDLNVTARAGQLEQVLVNLIDNAILAMPKGGKLMVRAGGDGEQVTVTVADSGGGMSEEVRRRATEPFFTTRAPGDGSGLGLAIVASIVAAHRGALTIDSAPERGTTVEIRIPRR